MTKFILIDAAARTANIEDHRNLAMAEAAVGLDPKAVDHGTLRRGLGYTVFEFSLFVPAETQHYFAIGSILFAGNCVIYAYDQSGETIDVEKIDFPLHFFLHMQDVQNAIDDSMISRPEIRVNGKLHWRWPDPPPPEFPSFD